MNIRLEPERCTGHGRCYVLAPEVFDEDEQGRCVLKLATVPSKLHEQARTGVESCPEHALAIVETGAAAT
ncbi:MAG: ferredoxin [bacterium]|jgi:ferredoxin